MLKKRCGYSSARADASIAPAADRCWRELHSGVLCRARREPEAGPERDKSSRVGDGRVVLLQYIENIEISIRYRYIVSFFVSPAAMSKFSIYRYQILVVSSCRIFLYSLMHSRLRLTVIHRVSLSEVSTIQVVT